MHNGKFFLIMAAAFLYSSQGNCFPSLFGPSCGQTVVECKESGVKIAVPEVAVAGACSPDAAKLAAAKKQCDQHGGVKSITSTTKKPAPKPVQQTQEQKPGGSSFFGSLFKTTCGPAIVFCKNGKQFSVTTSEQQNVYTQKKGCFADVQKGEAACKANGGINTEAGICKEGFSVETPSCKAENKAPSKASSLFSGALSGVKSVGGFLDKCRPGTLKCENGTTKAFETVEDQSSGTKECTPCNNQNQCPGKATLQTAINECKTTGGGVSCQPNNMAPCITIIQPALSNAGANMEKSMVTGATNTMVGATTGATNKLNTGATKLTQKIDAATNQKTPQQQQDQSPDVTPQPQDEAAINAAKQLASQQAAEQARINAEQAKITEEQRKLAEMAKQQMTEQQQTDLKNRQAALKKRQAALAAKRKHKTPPRKKKAHPRKKV